MADSDLLIPHPLFRDLKDESEEQVAVAAIDGIVVANANGQIVLTPSLEAQGLRYLIQERDILHVQRVGSKTDSRVRLFVREDAEVVERSVVRIKAVDLSAELVDEESDSCSCGSESQIAARAAAGGGSNPPGFDCLLGCNRKKRRCEGLFPTPAKRNACQRTWIQCRRSCIDKADKNSYGWVMY